MKLKKFKIKNYFSYEEARLKELERSQCLQNSGKSKMYFSLLGLLGKTN